MYCMVVYCIISYRIVSYRIVSYCIVLYCTVLYHIVLRCIDVYVYVYVYKNVYVYVKMHVRIYIHVYIYIHTHINIHICMYVCPSFWLKLCRRWTAQRRMRACCRTTWRSRAGCNWSYKLGSCGDTTSSHGTGFDNSEIASPVEVYF